MKRIPLFPFLVLLLLLATTTHANTQADETFDLTLSDGTDISIARFGNSDQRILWLPSEQGLESANAYPLAHSIAAQGMEIWLADLHSSFFLTPGRTSLNEIPPAAIAELIGLSLPQQPGQQLFLLSSGRGAALTLMGLQNWQQSHPDDTHPGGAVLLYPNLTAGIPEPGQPETWLPVAEQTRAALFVVQPEKSGRRWYLQDLLDKLNAGGSSVYAKLIRDAGDGYLTRPERSVDEIEQAEAFPALLQQALGLLAATEPRALSLTTPPVTRASKQNSQDKNITPKEGLQPFPGNQPAPELRLTAIDGNTYDLKDYRGKVVLLNFWATWCPPCVEEIPSLGRLQKRFPSDAFSILSVDIGEEAADVEDFLQTIKAEYPVMLDPNGSRVKDWKLRAFPTTFVLDTEGYIRMAYFGGLAWDDDSVVQTLADNLHLKPLPAP